MKFTIQDKQLRLDLSLSKSSIEIIETAEETAEIEFTGLRKKTVDEVFNISFRNNRLYIKERSPRNSPMFDTLFNSGWSSDLKLKIPAQTLLSGTISSLKGDITADRLNFCGKIKTVMGTIGIKSLISDGADIQNVGGNIGIDRFEGVLKTKSMAGKIVVEEGVFKDLSIRGVTGDVRLAGHFELENEGEVNTLSGDIHLNIMSFKGEAMILVSTMSGNPDVIGDFPEDAVQIKRRMPFLKNHPFKSFFPSMKNTCASFFSMSKDDDEVEVHAETVPDDDDNVKMILEMLSQGKISAEEAEKLIKALGKK
ncbi:DUF4097 family beta strand repeat protein [bacterium]|nr:DUF4097 family beta strand repeat protein [bacterium]